MILSLQTYFDIGVSYGLGDNIFSNAPETSLPGIPGIGLRNPLGLGLVRRLEGVNDELLEQWRTGAAAKVNVPEMELGFEYATKDAALATLTFDEFKDRLRRCIHEHMPTCELTIYAVGTVFLRLDLPATMPLPFLRGFGRCFEYTAYEVPIATALLRVARATIEERLGRKNSALQKLSKRPDPDKQADESGNTESRLITSFTYVAICVDKGDDVGAVKCALLPQQPTFLS